MNGKRNQGVKAISDGTQVVKGKLMGKRISEGEKKRKQVS